MSQSKQPAICNKCKIIGPSRKLALSTGWTRPIQRSQLPNWFCPECTKLEVQERAREFATRKSERNDRSNLTRTLLLSSILRPPSRY